MLLEQNDILVMCGDSVTDACKELREGESANQALAWGRGYVYFTKILLDAYYPELNIRVINQGVSGDTSRQLLARFDEDCAQKHPDWVTIMIGVNDIWRQLESAQIKERHVYIDEYERNLCCMIEKLKGKAKGIILLKPFFMEINRQDLFRRMIDDYGACMAKVAARYDCPVIDTQSYFDKYLETALTYALSNDRVHPNGTGHMIIAKALLNHIGFDFNRI